LYVNLWVLGFIFHANGSGAFASTTIIYGDPKCCILMLNLTLAQINKHKEVYLLYLMMLSVVQATPH
jgi:hypothetical protein